MSDPSPLTWTLRLKSHKTTILLHTDPLTPFGTIKSHLLTALHESGGSIQHATTLTPLPLPESASEIQLGRLANPNDASEGFVVGEWERVANADEEDEAAGSKGKGKGKARADGGGGGGAGIKDCPKGAGLKDGAVLAFRWLGDGVWEGGEEGDVDIDGMDGGKGKSEEVDMWGVKLASFEDAYPEEGGMDE